MIITYSCFTDEVSVVCTLIEYWLAEILPMQRQQRTWCPQIQRLRERLWITSRSLIVISHCERDLQSCCFIVKDFKKLGIIQLQQQFGFFWRPRMIYSSISCLHINNYLRKIYVYIFSPAHSFFIRHHYTPRHVPERILQTLKYCYWPWLWINGLPQLIMMSLWFSLLAANYFNIRTSAAPCWSHSRFGSWHLSFYALDCSLTSFTQTSASFTYFFLFNELLWAINDKPLLTSV